MRGICPTCKRLVGLTPGKLLYLHKDPKTKQYCPRSGLWPARDAAGNIIHEVSRE